MGDTTTTMVPNPMISWLKNLKTSADTAAGEVPDIESPTSNIGPGGAWTGPQADEAHEDLAAIAQPLKTALKNLTGDVQERLDSVQPKEVTPETAKLIRIEYGRF